MDTLQLLKFSKSLSIQKYVKDVLPKDLLKKPNLFPLGYIINADESNMVGSHWLYICYTAKDKVIFFDSFGYEPLFYNLEKHFEGMECTFQNRILQNKNSKFCGYYCLYIAYMLSKGFLFKNIIRVFSEDSILNDEFIVNFILKFKDSCNYSSCLDIHYNQKCKCFNE